MNGPAPAFHHAMKSFLMEVEMRSIAMIGALAVFATAPAAAQGKFRTGTIDPNRGQPTTTTAGDILGGVLGRDQTISRSGNTDHIPPGQLPPAGMCRIWIDGVPPGRQPAPTDCQTAVATKPANARVIFGGDGTSFPGKGNGKFKNKEKQRGHDADDGRDRDDNRVMRGGQSGVLGSILPSTSQREVAKQKGKKGKGHN
jgi:hypothetical protein